MPPSYRIRYQHRIWCLVSRSASECRRLSHDPQMRMRASPRPMSYTRALSGSKMDGLSAPAPLRSAVRSHERCKTRIPYEFASIHVFLRTVRPGITAYSGTIEQPDVIRRRPQSTDRLSQNPVTGPIKQQYKGARRVSANLVSGRHNTFGLLRIVRFLNNVPGLDRGRQVASALRQRCLASRQSAFRAPVPSLPKVKGSRKTTSEGHRSRVSVRVPVLISWSSRPKSQVEDEQIACGGIVPSAWR